QMQVSKKEDVLNALSQLGSNFRSRAGESTSTIKQHNTPLAEATTPSLEALEAYSLGWKVHSASGAIASLPLFIRAVGLDPNFAVAHASLGRIYGDLDESDLSAQSTTTASRLRNHTSDRERFLIDTAYEMQVTGNLQQAGQTCEAWAETYPHDALPHTFLAGIVNKVFGRFENGIDQAKKAIDLDPEFAFGYY